MKATFSVMFLENSPRRWENCTQEKIKTLSGKYIYLASGGETPDYERIGMMMRRALHADLIAPVPHSVLPSADVLEEPLSGPFSVMSDRFRLVPLLSGMLIRKRRLLRCLNENRNDWIHAPCPDFFLLFAYALKTAIVRTDYLPDRETFQWYCGNWREAVKQLEHSEWSEEEKLSCRIRMERSEDYLIDRAAALNFDDGKISEFFSSGAIIHNYFTRHPERLSGRKLPYEPFRPAPVRRLAVFCEALRSGGAERCASLLLRRFSEIPRLHVCLIRNFPPAPGDYSCPDSVEVIVLPKEFSARRVRLRDLLREKQIDTCLLFDHFLENFYYDLLTARELGIRTVAMEHNTFAFPLYIGDPGLLSLRQAVYPGADLITCLSRSDEYLWNQQGIRARYMPNPLTFDTSERPEFTPRKGKNLIFIARLIPEKGVLDALRVVERVKTVHPDVKLYMLGSFPDPAYEHEIHNWVKKHGLSGQVEFTGFTRSVEKYVSVSAVYLMPSSVEGYPMTLMEVKSYGLPTVSYSLPYLEAGKEEYGTLSVPRGDWEGMAAKVSELLSDPNELNEHGRRAWESLKYFDNAMVFARWDALFRWLETGEESAELAPPVLSAEQQLELLRLQTGEIIHGLNAMETSPFSRRKILNRLLSGSRKQDLLMDLLLRCYFPLREKLQDGAPRSLRLLFSALWALKRFYRRLKPWKDQEQGL